MNRHRYTTKVTHQTKLKPQATVEPHRPRTDNATTAENLTPTHHDTRTPFSSHQLNAEGIADK
jgi:hypothetical protein